MLRRVTLNGFKSIKAMDLELRSLNVLIGANGAGKSNLVSFFKMLNEMMGGRLQQYIGTNGRAQSILHYGPKVTPEMRTRLEFQFDDGSGIESRLDVYAMRLTHSTGDSLAFVNEIIYPSESLIINAQGLGGTGHQETRIGHAADSGSPIKRPASALRDLLNQCRVYHFHDTSLTARVRQYCYIGDNRSLMNDAGNVAAFLMRLRETNRNVYQNILSTIRLIAPFFKDFDLEPTGIGPDVILNWRDNGSDQIFGPHQLSDGTLRAICLITLLLQPVDELPMLIIVDEPELGLHPYALNVIAALFKKASHHTQVLISTQSTSFLDNFDAEDVIVVSREGKTSQFTRPDPEKLESWLDEYSLGEVWEKNVIGGGPH